MNLLKIVENVVRALLPDPPELESAEKLKTVLREDRVGSDLQRLEDMINLTKLQGLKTLILYSDETDLINALHCDENTCTVWTYQNRMKYANRGVIISIEDRA